MFLFVISWPLYKLWSWEVSVVGVARWSSFTAVCQFVCFPFTGQSSSLVVPSSSSAGSSHLQSQPRTHPVHAVAWCQGVPRSIPQSGHGLLIPSSPWYQRSTQLWQPMIDLQHHVNITCGTIGEFWHIRHLKVDCNSRYRAAGILVCLSILYSSWLSFLICWMSDLIVEIAVLEDCDPDFLDFGCASKSE